MACRFSELVVDCRDPEALAAWWAEVLGYRVLSREDGDVEIGPRAGGGTGRCAGQRHAGKDPGTGTASGRALSHGRPEDLT